MRELKQEEHLQESTVFEYDAFGKPTFCDAEQLREEPRLVIAFLIAEVFFQREFCQRECNLVGPVILEIIEGVEAG
jgi:hypothetical protein